MKQLIITRGLPGSGKSTYATDLIVKDPTFRRVNKDLLRLMFNNGLFSSTYEGFIHQASQKLISMALSEGLNVIVDNTHLDASSVKQIHKLAEIAGDVEVKEIWFKIPIEECHRRNNLRTGIAKVPASVIDRMANASGIFKAGYGNCIDKTTVYPAKIGAEPLVQNETLPEAIIVDLDGTLALIGDRSPYDASRCDVVDRPNKAVVSCVLAMAWKGYHIIFMSGREAKDELPTRRFIEQHCQEEKSWSCHVSVEDGKLAPVDYDLFMRATGDTRKDNIVKRELFDAHVRDKWNVVFTLDDRDQVVKLWRDMGLTCMQVAYGDF